MSDPGNSAQIQPKRPAFSLAQLQAEAARCTAIVASSEDAIISKTLDGIVTSWNPAAERLFGYRDTEIIGLPLTVTFPADHLGEEKTILEKMRAGERIDHFKTVRIHKDGTPLDVSVSLSPIKADDGTIIGVSTIVRNLSEQQSAERALRAAYEQLERQTYALDKFAIVAETDAQGRITYVNDLFCQVSKYSREELLGRTHRLVNSGYHGPEFWTSFWAALRRGQPWRGDICNKAKDGSIYWVDTTVVPFLDAEGKPVKFLAIRAIITDRKQTEQKLEKTGEGLQLIANYSNDGIWDWDIRTNTVFYSRRFKGLLEYQDDEFPNTLDAFLSHLHPDDQESTWTAVRQHLDNDAPYQVEYRIRTKSGRYIWVFARGACVRDENGTPYRMAGSFTNISERKEAERELGRARDEAIAANSAKSRFMANMSHEIRTPMNAVLGMAHLIEKSKLSPKQRDYLETLISSASSLLGIINDVLDMSKMEAGKISIEEIVFSLRQCIEESMGIVTRSARAKGLVFGASVHESVPDDLVGDPGRIRQILVNLLSNAVKFTNEGEVMMTVKSKRDESHEVTLSIAIRDTGIGMGSSTVESLFKPFFQADDSSARKHGGTGLGLAISKSLTESMGGTISVESEPAKGTVFCVCLPLKKSVRPASARQQGILKGMRVLIVDDHEGIRVSITRQLRHSGANIAGAASGPVAIKQLVRAAKEGKPFDAILLDSVMPGMSGLQTARAIAALPAVAPAPIILTSGADDFPDEKELAHLGVRSCLAKPFTVQQLTDTLSAQLCDRAPLAPVLDSRPAHPRKRFKKHRILLAEDNAANQKLMQALLGDLGLTVDMATNGKEVLKALTLASYDMIFMDCQMPEMDGYEATREIRRHEAESAHIPIVALTAHALAGDRSKCLAAGMDDYLTKPIDPFLLQRAITKWLGLKNTKKMSLQTAVPHADQAFDPSVLRRLTGGDRQRFNELVESYRRATQRDLLSLGKALKTKNKTEAHRIAHGCAGASESYGMLTLGRLFRQLESHLEKGKLTAANRLWPSILESFDAIKNIIVEI